MIKYGETGPVLYSHTHTHTHVGAGLDAKTVNETERCVVINISV